MGKGKELTEDERSFIVRMKSGGASITAIAKETKRPRGTIAILRKFRLSGKVRTLKWSGRSGLTTERENRCLTRQVKENRRSKLPKLWQKKWSASISKTVSERTTRRRLKSLGYNGRQARKKTFISTKNQKKRMQWAKEMVKKQ